MTHNLEVSVDRFGTLFVQLKGEAMQILLQLPKAHTNGSCQFPVGMSDTCRIRPNLPHCAVRFFKITGNTLFGKICIFQLRIHYKKRSEKELFDDDYAIFF